MAHWIDAFLSVLTERGAEALELESGEPARLRFPEATHVVSRTSVSLEHLLALARQGLGHEGWQQFEAYGDSEWTEARSGRTFRFRVSGGPGRVHLDVALDAGDEAPPAFASAAELVSVLRSAGTAIEITAAAAEAPAAELLDARDRSVAEVERLLRTTFEMKASDLHLTTGMPPLVRIDGRMQPLDGEAPLGAEALRQLLFSVAPERNLEELAVLWDSDFAHEIAGVSRFRVNVFQDRRGVGGVFRVIPNQIPRCEQLGLPETLVEMTQLSKGIVLVTGPTGSGKSTTLAALVDHINDTRHDHVITIEDPIEFVHESRTCLVNQREVGTHTQSFKRALREALREDPDIVLVGEMRDLETVHIALETAETGHLVFGTLHTTSGPSTVDRLIDQFPAAQQQQIRVMLADTLRCVVAQVLCRRKRGGRVAALEIMMGTPAIANLIREGKTHQMMSIMQTSRADGMVTMTDSLVRLVQEDVISAEEALARATHRDEVMRALERMKTAAPRR